MEQILDEISKINLISLNGNRFKSIIEVYNEPVNDTYTMTYHNSQPVHEDLVAAMDKLTFYVEKISGTCFPELHVEGFYKQACGENELLSIYCAQRNEKGCPMNLCVRLMLGADSYPWIDQLLEDIALCEREALLYIKEGKRYGLDTFVTYQKDNHTTLSNAA